MKRTIWILLGIAAMVSVALVSGHGLSDSQAGVATVVAVEPATQNVATGGSSSFEVRVGNVTDLAGYGYLINFDPSIIQVDSQSPGSFPTDCRVQVKTVDNIGGQIDFACITAPLTGEDGVDELLMTVNFTCAGRGTSAIDLKFVELTDSQAGAIAHTVQDGEVVCNAETTVLIDPATQKAEGAGTFEVRIHDVVDLAGYGYLINFDPSIIQVDSQSPGIFPTDCRVQVKTVDNIGGQIDFACITAPLTGEDGVDELLMTVNFTCAGEGSSPIDLKVVELTNSQAGAIARTVQDGKVDCNDNPPPVADDFKLSVGPDSADNSWTPLASDPDNDPLTCSITTPAQHGTATVADNCSSGTYTPNTDFTGKDSFVYEACDPKEQCDTGAVQVNVIASPRVRVGEGPDSQVPAQAGSLVTIPVWLENAAPPGVASLTVDVRYDPAILQVEGCEAKPDVWSLPICQPNFASDTVRIGGSQTAGVSGDKVAVFNITFRVSRQAQPGAKTELTPDIVQCNDASGNELDCQPIHGQIVVIPPNNGDVDCDGSHTTQDVTFILANLLNQMPKTEECPSGPPFESLFGPAADADKDGDVDTSDALLVLHCAVGNDVLPNGQPNPAAPCKPLP